MERSEYVIFNGLVRASLHQRHMLVRRSVEHDVRPVLRKQGADPHFVAHGADAHGKVQLRMRAVQLLLDGIGVVFIDIQQHKALRRMTRDLAAELAADGTAAARDEDRLAGQVARDLGKVDLHAVTAEQVLHVHIADLLDVDFAVCQLINARQDLQAAACLLAKLQNISPFAHGCRRNGQHDLFDAAGLCQCDNVVPRSGDFDVANVLAELVAVVVDDAHHVVLGIFARLEFPQHEHAGTACTDEHRALLALLAAGAVQDRADETIGKA